MLFNGNEAIMSFIFSLLTIGFSGVQENASLSSMRFVSVNS